MANGTATRVAGTGTLGPYADGIPATHARILPSDVVPAVGGTLLLTQTEPVPALRRIDRAGLIRTVVR